MVGIDVNVPRCADLVAVDGHLVFAVTFNLGLFVDVRSDALVLERTLGDAITLAERVATLEARELVAALGAERTRLEVVPVVAGLLVGRALVVGVVRRRVLLGVQTPSSSSRLSDRQAGDEEGEVHTEK